jgi:prepilin-type N-terminal cleavage/methylation domain-containing protein
MLKIGKNNNQKNSKKEAFSLVEILVSLAIFSVIITSVISLTMSMVSAQKNIQAKMFLAQTAQTTIESMSRQIRYGYSYSGTDSPFSDLIRINEHNEVITQQLNASGEFVASTANSGYAAVNGVLSDSALTATSTYQLLTNVSDSPYIIFEQQNGNPGSFADQNAFCVADNRLYKVTEFTVQSSGSTYESFCKSGSPMLPDNITVEKISFDIYGGDVQNPKNPMVRIRLRLKHEVAGTLDMQTTITQRLVTYF